MLLCHLTCFCMVSCIYQCYWLWLCFQYLISLQCLMFSNIPVKSANDSFDRCRWPIRFSISKFFIWKYDSLLLQWLLKSHIHILSERVHCLAGCGFVVYWELVQGFEIFVWETFSRLLMQFPFCYHYIIINMKNI